MKQSEAPRQIEISVANIHERDGGFSLAWARPVAIGLACLALSLGWNVLLNARFGLEALSNAAAGVLSYEPEVADWVISGLLTPLSETVIMALVWILLTKAFERIPRHVRVGPAYVTIVVVVGFLVHGGTPLALSRAAAFALLGILFVRAHAAGGVRRAWTETAAAHVVWNITGLVLLDVF